MSWLGWVGGLVSLLLFYCISLWCSLMLSGVYKVNGKRHPTYSDAVLGILGRRSSRVLVVVQRVMLCLAAIGYAIAAADSMTYIANRSCSAGQSCMVKHWQMALVFGGEPGSQPGLSVPQPSPLHLAQRIMQHIDATGLPAITTGLIRGPAHLTVMLFCWSSGLQALLSLLPSLESVWLISALGAVMSLAYSVLTIGLGASQVQNGLGTLWGRPAPAHVRVFSIFNALGQMAFGEQQLATTVHI
jgi:hypothetical protein